MLTAADYAIIKQVNEDFRKYGKPRHLVIDALGHEQAVSQSIYETKRSEAIEATGKEARFFDEVNDRERFRHVFKTWDFSQFAR